MAFDPQSQAFISNLVQSVAKSTFEAMQEQNRGSLEAMRGQSADFSNSLQALASRIEHLGISQNPSNKPLFDLKGVNLNLPLFDGSQDVKQWLVNLEDFITLKNISKTDCRMLFRVATTGVARQFLDQKPNVVSFEDLSLAFKDRFIPKGQDYRIREQLQSLKMQRNNLDQYVNDFEFLIQQCTGMQEIDKLFFFRQGLPRSIAIELVAKDVKTLEDAYKVTYAFATARNMCPVPVSFRTPSMQTTEATPMDLDKRQVPSNSFQRSGTSRPSNQDKKKSTSNIFPGRRKSQSPSNKKSGNIPRTKTGSTNKFEFQARKNENRCYNCGKPGHFSKDCTDPCGFCNKTGHTSNKCFQRQKKWNNSPPPSNNNRNRSSSQSKWKQSEVEQHGSSSSSSSSTQLNFLETSH
jgi:hypothetical protein